MTVWNAQRAIKAVLSAALLFSGMAFAVSPVTASTVGSRAATPTCGPKTVTQHPAPGVGHEAIYTVDSAGTIKLLETSTTTLKVTDADAKTGWKDVIITRAGTRVHVGFQQVGAPEEQERVWARLNTLGTPGTVVSIVLQSCT